LLLSRNGQGWRINNGGVVDYQRLRDFVLQSIALAAVGIVVIPPLLDLVPAVVDNNKAATTASVVAINPSARLPRITHKVYLNVKFGSKG
jgi:hypothetical protein